MIFGYENLMEDGDPVENCIDYDFKGWKICDCGNVLLGMLQRVKYNYLKTSKREWENLLVDTKNIYDHIGGCCFLSIEQYLYSYSYSGIA